MDATALRANVIALNTERLNVIEQLRGELDATAGRERSGEEQQRIDRMQADIMRIQREVNDLVTIETQFNEAEQIRQAQASAYGLSPQEERAGHQYDAMAELRSFLRGQGGSVSEEGRRFMEVDIRGVRAERELLRQGASAEEIRAMAWDTTSTASLVPTTLARTMYEYMEASTGILRAPTTMLNTTSGEKMEFPRVASHAVATQVIAQGTALAGTDPTFSKMALDAYKVGELVKVPSELISDSGVAIVTFLGANMGRAVRRKVAEWFTVGDGSSKPVGIMTQGTGTAGTIATSGSLITPTVEKLIDLKYSINDEYRSDPSCGWLMNDSTAGTLSKLRDGGAGTVGAFLWRPSLTQGISGGTPDMLLDKPVYIETNVSAAGSANLTVGFGAFNAFYTRWVGNPVIEQDNSRYFDTDEIGFRVKTRVDSDLIDYLAWNRIRQAVA